jgi:hypothetical protein
MNNDILHTVEIKLRFSNELMKWEDRRVAATFTVTTTGGAEWIDPKTRKVVDIVKQVKKTMKQAGAVEARWNWQGSPQGHYTF